MARSSSGQRLSFRLTGKSAAHPLLPLPTSVHPGEPAASSVCASPSPYFLLGPSPCSAHSVQPCRLNLTGQLYSETPPTQGSVPRVGLASFSG